MAIQRLELQTARARGLQRPVFLQPAGRRKSRRREMCKRKMEGSGMSEKRDLSLVDLQKTYFVRVSEVMNTHYPLRWFFVFYFIAFTLLAFPGLCFALARFHDDHVWFLSMTKSMPYSSDFAKSYILLLIFFVPIQIASLLLAGKEYFFLKSIPGIKGKEMVASFVLFGGSVLYMFIVQPGETMLVRLLGRGGFSVVIVAPLVISALPLSICLFYWGFERRAA